VADLVRGLPKYRRRRLENRCPDGPGLAIRADMSEIKQVLLNLVVNALDAVEDDQGTVRIEGLERDGRVVVRVIDNGRGMSPESLERVFEPFYSDRRGRDGDASGGTGLGLSISHAIVERHGGRIAAQSGGPGMGSSFTLDFPALAEGQG